MAFEADAIALPLSLHTLSLALCGIAPV